MTRIQFHQLPLARRQLPTRAAGRAVSPAAPASAGMAVDIRDDGAALYLDADLPGVAADSIGVHFENGLLTIEAQRGAADAAAGSAAEHGGHEPADNDGAPQRWLRRERVRGRIERRFRLPDDIDVEAISAAYSDGVLSLRIPRSQALSRRIAVKH